MIKKPIILAISFCLLAGGLGIPRPSVAQAVPDKKAILTAASQAYYNLRANGLDSFTCSVTPNWEMMLQEQRKQNSQLVDSELVTLDQLHFTFAVGADNKMSLMHNDVSGLTKEMADSVNQIQAGMNQMASGFFDTWSFFMLDRPFPQDSEDYQLVATGPEYKLTYKDSSAGVVTKMGHDFAISELAVTTPEFHSVVQPGFTKMPGGFVLTSYNANFQSGKTDDPTQLTALISYQIVDGLQIVQKLDVNGNYGPNKFAVQLVFSACQVTKKPAGN